MENESLHFSKHHCSFKAVLVAFERKDEHAKISNLFSDSLYKGIRWFLADLEAYGLSMSDLLGAVDDPSRLNELARLSGIHEYVLMFNRAASSGGGPEAVLRRWVDQILAQVSSQIACRVVPNAYSNFPSFNRAQESIIGLMQREVGRLARKLAANPNWKPRRSSNPPVVRDDATISLRPMTQGLQ